MLGSKMRKCIWFIFNGLTVLFISHIKRKCEALKSSAITVTMKENRLYIPHMFLSGLIFLPSKEEEEELCFPYFFCKGDTKGFCL